MRAVAVALLWAAVAPTRLCSAGSLGGRVRRTVEPSFLDDPSAFLASVQKEPSDILLLLYGPRCPDCQWFLGRWANVASRLERLPSIEVWTVADPALLAPKPFEHKHLPTIFFIPEAHKDRPSMLPEPFFNSYLTGNSTKPWQVQDEDFEDALIDFAGRLASRPMVVYPPPPKKLWKPQRDLEKLAAKEWGMLYGDSAEKVFEKKDVSALKKSQKMSKTVLGVAQASSASAAPILPGGRPGQQMCDRSCTQPSWAARPLQSLRLRTSQVTAGRRLQRRRGHVKLVRPKLGVDMERRLEQLLDAP